MISSIEKERADDVGRLAETLVRFGMLEVSYPYHRCSLTVFHTGLLKFWVYK